MLENNIDLNKTDEELVNLTLQNKEYYKYLVERYREKLKRYIFRIIRISFQDAEDILQEVFIKAYTNLNDFDQYLKFSSWIYRIAHNEAITFLRKNKNRLAIVDFEIDKNLVETAKMDLDIKEEIDQKYFAESISKIINSFGNKDYKDVLILKYFEDKNYQEISDILKKPMGTISALLNRAKKYLKKELSKNSQLDLK